MIFFYIVALSSAIEIHVLNSTDVVDYRVLNSNWNNCKIGIETNEHTIVSLKAATNAHQAAIASLINASNIHQIAIANLNTATGAQQIAIVALNASTNAQDKTIASLINASNIHQIAIANLNQTTNYLAPYFGQFSTWSPTINADQYTLPTGLNDIISNDYLYAVNYASPTTTVTFAHPGIYKVYVEVGHAHAGGYTVMVFYLYKGGTASIKTPVMSNRSFLFASGIAAQNSTENGSVTIIVEVSAPGQTLDFKLGGRSHVTDFTKHWFYAGFTVTALQVF